MEQTTSCAWPNTVVAKYFESIGKYPTEDIEKKTAEMLSASYQRVLTFQRSDGGFALWCDEGGPGDVHYTALGLMQLSEMSQVTYIDPAVVEHAIEFLAANQGPDGKWQDLMHTASIAWALAVAGKKGPMLEKALDVLRNEAPAVSPEGKPTVPVYTRALAGIALHVANPQDPVVGAIIQSLAAEAKVDLEFAHWASGQQTLFGSHGEFGDVTGTGVVAYLLLLAGKETGLAKKAVTYIVSMKGDYGGWGATESTVAALRALSLADAAAQGTVDVVCNGVPFGTVELSAKNSDILNVVELDACLTTQDNPWTFGFSGIGQLQYQFQGCFNREFDGLPEPPEELVLDVGWFPTTPKQGDTVTVSVSVGNVAPGGHGMSIITVPVPLGMSVKGSTLDDLKEADVLQEWEVRDRRVTIYLEDLPAGAQVDFTFDLAATLPVKTTIPPSTLYSYYNPSVRVETEPVDLLVSE